MDGGESGGAPDLRAASSLLELEEWQIPSGHKGTPWILAV